MKITKFPEQKRTILIGYSKPKLIYLPPLVFIKSRHHLLLAYEYNGIWWKFGDYFPNVSNASICFGSIKPSIDNFWNSFFDDISTKIISKPNWWKNIKNPTPAYDYIIIHADDVEFIKEHILSVSDYAVSQTIINAVTYKNWNIFEYLLNYDIIHIRSLLNEIVRSKDIKFLQRIKKYVENNCHYIESERSNHFDFLIECTIKHKNVENIKMLKILLDKIRNVKEVLIHSLKVHSYKSTFIILKHMDLNLSERDVIHIFENFQPDAYHYEPKLFQMIIQKILEISNTNVEFILKIKNLNDELKKIIKEKS